MGFGIKTKLKRRNLEKRKEKSRDAARTRRSRETEIFSSLSKEIPVNFGLLSQMDKASVIRLAITHLKIRKFCEHVLDRKKIVQTFPSVELENKLNKLYYKALNGFVMVLSNTGNLIFITESILHHLGLSQVDLLGQSVFDFIHPCDHSDLRDICGINKSNSSSDAMKSLSAISSMPLLSLQGDKQKKDFFMRMRCIHPCKGRSLSLKTNAYKVIHCSGFLIPCAPNVCHTASLKYSQEDVSFLVVECDSILHPSNHNIRLDSRSFISHHTMDMKFIYCDDGICSLLGYSPDQLIGTCLYEFHHALDNNTITCAYKTLFSKGQSVTGLYRFLAKSGGYAWVETQASLVKNPQTDKPQSVICINSVVTGILCAEEILGMVQQPIFKSLSILDEHLKQMNNECDSKAECKQCLYDNLLVPEVSISSDYKHHEADIDNDCEPKLEAKIDDVILSNDKLDVRGVKFSTERILNSAKSADDEKLGCQMENEYADPVQHSEEDNDVDAGLPNVSSSASLFKLLKEFDDDGDEMRAPFIPMDDLIFVSNTSDGPLLTSIEDYDFPVFATENVGFDDISYEVSEETIPCTESLVMTPLKDDAETQELSCHNVPTSFKNKGRSKRQKSLKEEEEEDGNQSPSVLKNLLLKGEDTNYGYRLMTGNQDLKHEKVNAGGSTSKVSALYQLLCS